MNTIAFGRIKNWILTTGTTVLGGGIMGAFSAMLDRSKYHFPHDFGSGKLWDYFGMGAALTFGGILLRSPLGVKLMAGFKEGQAQMEQNRKDLEQAKATFHADAEKVKADIDAAEKKL